MRCGEVLVEIVDPLGIVHPTIRHLVIKRCTIFGDHQRQVREAFVQVDEQLFEAVGGDVPSRCGVRTGLLHELDVTAAGPR